MLKTIIAGVLTLIWTTAAVAQATLPDVSLRVGRAQEFLYNFTPFQYANYLGQFDIIWNNQPVSTQGGQNLLHHPPGALSSAYTAVNRVPVNAQPYGTINILTACANAPAAGGCTLAWFQANHPTWIIYTHDQLTPAYQFGDTTYMPLDISSVAVQAWLEANQVVPLIGQGYNSISIDNVTIQNFSDEEGTCSIKPTTGCTADGGTWTQIYTGAVNGDPVFINNRVSWLQNLTTFVHAQGAVSTMANVSYVPSDTTNTTRLIQAVDIWYDEDGITGDSNPSACSPAGAGSGVTGAAWIAKVAFIAGINGPYVAENSICPRGAWYQAGKSSNYEVMEYAAATYLLLKNSHTYMAVYFDNGTVGNGSYYNLDSPTANWPEFWTTHGAASGPYSSTGGVYSRTFANLLAAVNPGSTAASIALGASVYHRYDCTQYTGTVSIPPTTGWVLLNGASPGCVP